MKQLLRYLLVLGLYGTSHILFAQITPNTGDWKLRATSANDSYGNGTLQNSLTSGSDFTDKTTLNPNSTRTIIVRLPGISNGGMFVFNAENNIGDLTVSTAQSDDGSNWTALNGNAFLNGRDNDLQKADIPQSASNKWFRISFQNRGGSNIQLKELGMYQFQGGKNQYFLVLGASITESAGGFLEWKNTMNGRLGTSYQPVFFNWAIGGDNTNGLANKIDNFLAQHPQAGYVLLEIGGNDVSATRPISFSDYKGSYISDMNSQIRSIVQKITNAGKVAVLSRISYRNYPNQTSWTGKFQPAVNGGTNQENGSLPYNFVLDKIIKELTPNFWSQSERRGTLDFYQFTINNQQWLVAGDGIHFYGGDAYHVREFWTDFALKQIYTGQQTAPIQYPEFVSDLTNRATQAVVTAEISRSENDVFSARMLVEQMNNRVARVALVDRLDAVLGGSPPPPTGSVPVITQQPASQSVSSGGNVTFTISATGATSYQWQKNGTDISGATQTSYTFSNITISDNGAKFKCVATNSTGSVNSNEAILTVSGTPPPTGSAPIIITQPASQNAGLQATVTFRVTATSSSPITYQWQKNGINIAWAIQDNYILYGTSGSDNGNRYRCIVSNTSGSVTSNEAVLTIGSSPPPPTGSVPVITQQPASQSVSSGGNVTFTISATGATSYQWQKNGTDISGATQTSYVLFGVGSADNGTKIKCVVSNANGSVTSNEATLTVSGTPPPTGSAPIITTQPASQNAGLQATVTFRVTATSSSPITYQWQKNGINIAWAIQDNYILYGTSGSDNGNRYRCIVSNTSGSVTSNEAVLTIGSSPPPPTGSVPVITQQPASQSVSSGGNVTFTISATGATSYQWQKNGTDISGATQTSYVLFGVGSADNGTKIKCVVSNANGSVTSNEATLTISGTPPPTGGSGLTGRYYNVKADFSTTPVLTRTDLTVNFEWGMNALASGVNSDNFSVRWTGQVEAQYTEEYTFYITTDDGARVWVNNVQIINRWWDQGTSEWNGKIILAAGQKYDIKVEYYENTGNATCKLSWSSASQNKQIIPASQLFPLMANGTRLSANDEKKGGNPVTGKATLSLYPNPAKETLNLQFDAETVEKVQIKVFNMLGQSVMHKSEMVQQNYSLEVDKLANGTYMLQVERAGKIDRLRFIKQ